MSEAAGPPAAPATLGRHLLRGAVGFGSVLAALALAGPVGPAALLLVVPGMVALRGCPMCWVAGLLEAISAGRLRRSCADGSCEVRLAAAGDAPGDAARVAEPERPDVPVTT